MISQILTNFIEYNNKNRDSAQLKFENRALMLILNFLAVNFIVFPIHSMKKFETIAWIQLKASFAKITFNSKISDYGFDYFESHVNVFAF